MTVLPEIDAEIHRLVLRDGWKIETTARRFGVHHTVVRRVITTGDETRPRGATPSILEPFKPYLVERLAEYPELTATRLLLELKDRGYPGGLAVIRRYVRKIRVARSRKAYLRVETEPGEQAQVDWGSFGQMRIGSTTRPLSRFAMVLSWSRAMFVDFSLVQRLDTFLRMHERAFEFFGGIPQKVPYDTLKSVVLYHVGSVVQFNPSFLVFAGHHLFEPLVQPTVIEQLKETAFAKRGGLARLRFFAPDCKIGFRDRSRRTAPDYRIAAAYEREIRKLAARWLDAEPTVIRLSEEADANFNAWWEKAELERRPGGRLHGSPRFMEWNGKDGEVLRLAGILHLAHGFDDRTEVSVEQIDRAICVHEVLTEHARDVLDGAPGLSEVQKLADRIARWLRSPNRENPRAVTPRDAMRQTKATRLEVDAALDLLETLGYVRAVDGPRRNSACFEVNPKLLEGGP